MRCLDWSMQNYDKVHWLPHPSAAVFPHQNDVKVQNCKRLSDAQYSNSKCQTRWQFSELWPKSAALDQRLSDSVPRLRLWRDTVHPIPSTLHQLRTKGRVSTGPLGRIKARVLSITSPCHLNLHKIETLKCQQLEEQREYKGIIKNGQERSKRKANHMTLTKALASACFPPLPSQKHPAVLPRQVRFGRSRAKIYWTMKWQQDCTPRIRPGARCQTNDSKSLPHIPTPKAALPSPEL